uniref:Uncharacterized protein n=1 Tax=candidate division CPR3 bacterium TaxID=2268181 RepID=A0A7C4M1F2_UNCC3
MDIKDELKQQVDGIFEEVGLGHLSDEEKRKIESMIMERFERVILEATLISLNDNQLKEFENAMMDEKNGQALVSDLAASIPGLAARIDMAVRHEWEAIKKMLKEESQRI